MIVFDKSTLHPYFTIKDVVASAFLVIFLSTLSLKEPYTLEDLDMSYI
jgi:hypothetical protein